MPNIELRFQPGVDLENTSLTNKGRWVASNWVRFRSGQPEKIGGYAAYLANAGTYLGVARYLFNWTALDSSNYLAVGTSKKFYIEFGQSLNDITPFRQVFTPLTNPFTTTNLSSTVQLNINANGANVGDYVVVSGVTGGPYNGLTAAQLNGEFLITAVDSAGNWVKYTVGGTANASGATGGTGITASFELTIGLDTYVYGTGWGTGTWSRGTWGSSAAPTLSGSMRLWFGDNWGQDLLFNVWNGGIYYWSKTGGLTTRATALSAVATDPNAPIVAVATMVTPYRHAMVFGTNPVGSTTQDPMWIRWSDQENITGSTAWTATLTNQAGGYRLTDGATIVCAKKTKQETLVWTNSAVYSMQFSGAPYIYVFNQIGTNISIMGPNAMATVGGTTTFWMGLDKFYVYNGVVSTLPCTLRKFVFDNLDETQAAQVYAFTVERFNEVWWLYVSEENLNGDMTNDSYVMFNYVDNVWAYGTIARTAWLDTALRANPVSAGGGQLYWQEYGADAVTNAGIAPINAFIESADLDVQQGEKFAFIRRIIPDVSFLGSNDTYANPQCNLTLYVRRNSGSAFDNNNAAGGDPGAVVLTGTNEDDPNTIPTTAIVEQFTTDIWVRLRGRQVKFRIDSNTLGVQWQLGTPLLTIQPDGRR